MCFEVLNTVPSLKEELGPVGSLQPENVLLLGVVRGLAGQSVVDSNHVVCALHKLPLLHLVLVLVLVEDQVAQNRVNHLPATLAERCCNTFKVTVSVSVLISATEPSILIS